MRLNGIIFLLCLLSAACSHVAEEGKVFIRGTTDKNGTIYITAFRNDVGRYLNKKSRIDSAIIAGDGSFEIKTPWKQEGLFSLETETEGIYSNLYARPGDELTVDLRSNTPLISGDSPSADYSRFIVSFIRKFYDDPVASHAYFIESNYLSPDSFQNYCTQRRNEQMQFYTGYFKDKAPSSQFAGFITSEIIYQDALDRLMFAWKKRMKGEAVIVDSVYYRFLENTVIENPKALYSPAYIRFLNIYIKDIYERRLAHGNLQSVQSGKLNAALEKYRIAREKLYPPFLEIVLYNIINEDLSFTGNLAELSGAAIDSLFLSISAPAD